MITFLEDYSSDGKPAVLLNDEPVPAPALIEDEDGFRYLLLGDEQTIPVRTWLQAWEAGICALVARDPGGEWLLLGAQKFVRDRVELPQQAAYTVPSGWVAYPNERLAFTDLAEYFPPEMFTSDTYTKAELKVIDETPTSVAGQFVSLHTHTEYSSLDGLSKIPEIIEMVVADGQGALGIADHGVCVGHPELQDACDKAGIKPIFGMEAYFQDDRHRRTKFWEEPDPDHPNKVIKKSDSAEARWGYTHISLWAMNDVGLRNLWAMSTESNDSGDFDGKPRLDWDTLERLNEGVIASTGCLRGPVAKAILAGDDIGARVVLGRMLEIFGDRLYIEIHTNSLPDQRTVNEKLIKYAIEYRIPLIACTDAHYMAKSDSEIHHTWLAVSTHKDVSDDIGMFEGEPEYFVHTADEVRAALSYLNDDIVGEAMSNTIALSDRCTARITGKPTPPIYSKGPNAIADDVRRLREICESNWSRKCVGKRHPESEYRERFEREFSLLERKAFCGYVLVVEDICRAARGEGILMSPCRGSGGGSLVLYTANAVETDPIEHNLKFERFLVEGRNSLPDVDMDFPMSKRDWIKNYVRKRWGNDHVVVIGTHTRLQARGAINDACRALESTLPAPVEWAVRNKLSEIIEESERALAGKHMPWEDICDQFADQIEPFRERYPTVLGTVDRIIGRLRTYSTHAAGVVISTDKPLLDLPQWKGDDGFMVTQFDMHALELLGYVKFDLLTLRTLDTIQHALDLIKEREGIVLDPYSWDEELDDPQVWAELCEGSTAGVFQIETTAGTKLTKQMQPKSIHDLAVMQSLVRPGPTNSGLTAAYLRRRSGEEEVDYPDPRMEPFLKDSYGCVIFQEQVMTTCMVLAGYDETEADEVRKILGKKLVEKVASAGEEFTRRAIEHGTKPMVAESLWQQLAEFSKYSFNYSHAVGYSLVAYYTAWLKVHYPVEFLAGLLATVKSGRIPGFVQEARRLGYKVLPPDINESRVDFSAEPGGIRYGLSSVNNIGLVAAQPIVAQQPYVSLEDFLERVVESDGSKVNMGNVKTLAAVGAFDELVPNRRALEAKLDWETSGRNKICQHRGPDGSGPGGLPCVYPWATEPDPPMVKILKRNQVPGGPTMAPKPPPKKCTIACRQYLPPDPFDMEAVVPYTVDDIMARERELLGVWLSTTPFDQVDPEDLKASWKASQIERGPMGEYLAIAMVTRVTPRITKNGDPYAWLTLFAQDGNVDIVCWQDEWRAYRQDLAVDSMIIAHLKKGSDLIKLAGLAPLSALV